MTIEIKIYGTIGDDVLSRDIINDLEGTEPANRPLFARINSEGGSVFEAVAIGAALARWPGKVTARVEGVAASAAGYLLAFADRVEAVPDSFVMVHRAWSLSIGDADAHERSAALLHRADVMAAKRLATRLGMPPSKVLALLAQEPWMTAEEAKQVGLVDHVIGDARSARIAKAMAALSIARDRLSLHRN